MVRLTDLLAALALVASAGCAAVPDTGTALPPQDVPAGDPCALPVGERVIGETWEWTATVTAAKANRVDGLALYGQCPIIDTPFARLEHAGGVLEAPPGADGHFSEHTGAILEIHPPGEARVIASFLDQSRATQPMVIEEGPFVGYIDRRRPPDPKVGGDWGDWDLVWLGRDGAENHRVEFEGTPGVSAMDAGGAVLVTPDVNDARDERRSAYEPSGDLRWEYKVLAGARLSAWGFRAQGGAWLTASGVRTTDGDAEDLRDRELMAVDANGRVASRTTIPFPLYTSPKEFPDGTVALLGGWVDQTSPDWALHSMDARLASVALETGQTVREVRLAVVAGVSERWALDGQGNALLAFRVYSENARVTLASGEALPLRRGESIALRFAPDGALLNVYRRGEQQDVRIEGIVADATGAVYVAGVEGPWNFWGMGGVGTLFVKRLDW